jgi:heat-inducible transcriptional repressor
MATSRLSERSRRILAALVAEYVETGEPVASATLVKRGGFGLSSATVRNVLASLEEMGHVYQPHTSAGRVPTDLGYRCYVDMLLETRRPGRSTGVEAQLLAQTRTPTLMGDALTTISHVLSEASHHVGFAVPPQSDEIAFQRIDFMPLAETKVLVVVVMRGGQVSNKVVDIGEPLQMSDLYQAANYLNEQFAGLPLGEVRRAVVARMAEERTLYDALLSRALRLAESTFAGLSEPQVLFIEGAASLVEETDEGGRVSLGTLRTLLHGRAGIDRHHRYRTQLGRSVRSESDRDDVCRWHPPGRDWRDRADAHEILARDLYCRQRRPRGHALAPAGRLESDVVAPSRPRVGRVIIPGFPFLVFYCVGGVDQPCPRTSNPRTLGPSPWVTRSPSATET